MRRTIGIFAVALAAGVFPAAAQNYPARPVRVIVTFPAGTATDIVARIVAQKLTELWGQNVIADNRGGAGGSIGSAIAARSVPDGYTLMINSNAHAANPSMYAKLPYDTFKDFTDIAGLTGTPNVMVVNPGSKVKTIGEFLADAKARPGKVNFASAGVGSGTHLNLEKFKLAAHIDVVHVPYKGSPEVITDLIGGRIDYFFCPLSAGLPFVRDGKLRGIAVTSAKRSSLIPNLPTVAESGVPGFEFLLWFGLWGPAGLPPGIVGKIQNDVVRALGSPDVRERLAAVANDPLEVKPKDFAKFVHQETADTTRIIKAAGIQPQ
ncbi:MAG TPA: tripartite tricarboxylate transporter substrate binding protein [Burkholderiales bacterium]|nr:tripartite tricarboxylate transporter substrate binding protein [Burkholderiales bacterium]